jgi:aromatic-L-amino-acid decarboxylase
MSHTFFDYETLEKGTAQMVKLIEECYAKTEGPVLPDVKPGFLRHQLPENPPEEGESVEHLIERTKTAIFPGVMNWQSPKYFGYYPSSTNVTSVLSEMFAVAFHTPGFSFTVSPVFTELENIVTDWSVKLTGLP